MSLGLHCCCAVASAGCCGVAWAIGVAGWDVLLGEAVAKMAANALAAKPRQPAIKLGLSFMSMLVMLGELDAPGIIHYSSTNSENLQREKKTTGILRKNEGSVRIPWGKCTGLALLGQPQAIRSPWNSASEPTKPKCFVADVLTKIIGHPK